MSDPERRTAAASDAPSRRTYITPETLEKLARSCLGGYGWQARFALLTGIDKSTLSRYMSGNRAIPKYLAVLAYVIRHVPPEELIALINAQELPKNDTDESLK